MSYCSNSSLAFGLNLLRVFKSVITRTQSIAVNETSFVTATRYEVRRLRCEPLTLPFVLEPWLSVTEQRSVDCETLVLPETFEDEITVSSPKTEGRRSETLSPLTNDSLSQSTSSHTIILEATPEPLETQPKQPPTTFSSTSAPSPFLAFLEASHLEASRKLLAEKSSLAPLDLGCAQFNSAYYRRHLPPTLPELSTSKKSKKAFCWRTTLDEIMKESGEECDEILDELVEESGTESGNQDIAESSTSSPSHSRSSSVSSYTTCIGSPVLSSISSFGKLQQNDTSTTITIQEPILNHPGVTPIRPSPSSFSSCKPTSFLDFIESSNQEMINRMQKEKPKNLTPDVECSQFNSAHYRRHLPRSLPPSKSNKTFCWKSKLDQMMREEEFEDISVDTVDQMTTKPTSIFPPSVYTSSSHVRSSSCSSDITVVDTATLIYFPKETIPLPSPVDLPFCLVR
ncbi:uncharacterized protein MELLADRAFT_58986 [Melampsora larici-populina 98AG31]|uniref:Uncharacterized protein n=1 Tax=Melampsora larici-populina (strain 98AG31 / pathotype 3-4-7) TaxID=747676 RepID=F4R6N1_MELLP|nr:uncharacterized protein MELLADRAFT_58986 [Melampsora larici-populina 98AG31]EGG11905.1 hypothetical protein MELLADRAFT_58986 [Melampsora larici-populina 98AG31]